MTPEERISKAIELGIQYGQIDGGHHKMWVIDQMLRILAGDDYEAYVNDPDDVDEYGEWDVGIAP